MKVISAANPIFPSNVFAMIVFVFTEVMFFTALVSAHIVIKHSNAGWAIPNGLRLPVATTAFNTVVLLASGVCLYLAGTALAADKRERFSVLYWRAVMLGAFFVAFQGYEWVQLISYGLTMHSSIFGACFFLLIGSHGFHALTGIAALAYHGRSTDVMSLTTVHTLQVFWFFIVGVWPVLYALVYF